MYQLKSILLVWLLITTAYSWSSESPVDKHLRILTWSGYAPREEVDKFKEIIFRKYSVNLRVTVDYVSSSDQFFDFVRAEMYEIIAPSHNLIHDPRYKLIEKDLIIPIDTNSIPNIKKLIPGILKLDYLKSGESIYSIPLTYGPYGLAYNSLKLKNKPDSWNVLWKPEHKGKYTINSDYYEANIYITALAMGIKKEEIHKIESLDGKEFIDKLRSLVKNSSGLWNGVDTADDLIGNSLATSWGFSFPELKRKGHKWKMAQPKEGTTMWVDGHSLTLTLKSDHLLKKIAEEWINYTLSDEFQYRAIIKGISSSPVNKNMIKEARENLLFSPPPIPTKNSESNYHLWPSLSIRERNYLKRLWQKALHSDQAP